MNTKTLLAVAVLLSVALAPSARAASLGDQLCEGVTLTEEEKSGLEPLLARYYALNGSKAALASTIKSGVERGCRGQCLSDLVELVNRSMRSGATCESAAKDVRDALASVVERCRATGTKAGPDELGRAVRGIMEAKLKDREKELSVVGEKPR